MGFQWVFNVYNMLLKPVFFDFRLIVFVNDKMKISFINVVYFGSFIGIFKKD